MAVSVLLVEDDDGIRTSLKLALEDLGYAVAEAPSAEAGLVLLGKTDPEVMLVDLLLGGLDGFAFITQARTYTDAPIIVVSALDAAADIVRALEAGADDYVTKPFQVEVVAARLNALRRRAQGAQRSATPTTDHEAIVLDSLDGPLVLDPGAGMVRRGDDPLPLTVTEYRLLAELASPPGRVLSRQVLLGRVWERGYFGDERVVDVHIRRLRTKVELDPGNPQLVVTVRGMGYRLDVR